MIAGMALAAPRWPPWYHDARSTTDPEKSYVVTLEGAGSCTCPHWRHRLAGTGRTCRHIDAKRTELAEKVRHQEHLARRRERYAERRAARRAQEDRK